MIKITLIVAALVAFSGCGHISRSVERDLDRLPRGEFEGLKIKSASNLGKLSVSIDSVTSTDESVTVTGLEAESVTLWTGENTFSAKRWHRLRQSKEQTIPKTGDAKGIGARVAPASPVH